MILTLAALAGGIALLGFAADQFVIGAARIAVIRRVPSIVVGLVIVGFGTSAPELLVSALAAGRDEADVAIGNIVGSNIVNLSLLLGIGALIVPLKVSTLVVRREALMVLGAVVLFGVVVQGGGIGRVEGVVLLAAMVGCLAVVIVASPAEPVSLDPAGGEGVSGLYNPRIATEVARVVIGLAGTVGAAQLVLWAALDLANRADLSEGFVGATIVAMGTSLPELVTVVQSARHGETDLIVGNLLGSNLFNALAVGGVVGLFGIGGLDAPNLTQTAVVASIVVAAVALVAMATNQTVTRREGAILVIAYFVLVPFLL